MAEDIRAKMIAKFHFAIMLLGNDLIGVVQ